MCPEFQRRDCVNLSQVVGGWGVLEGLTLYLLIDWTLGMESVEETHLKNNSQGIDGAIYDVRTKL